MGRMERYDNNKIKPQKRTEKNQDLYNDLRNFEKYTTLSDVSKIEAVDLNFAKKNYRTREGYHKIKEYDFNKEKPLIRKELDEFNYAYSDTNRTYDINQVLEKAKESREKDILERKRKLNNEKYNILESSEEELEKFKEETKLRHKPIENEEELENLINTITSKELRNQIDEATNEGSLLSDLMATNVSLDDVVKPIATKLEKDNKINSQTNDSKENITKMKKQDLTVEIDKSFYTKSLDLSEEDFLLEDDEEYIKTPKFIVFLRLIFSIILILAVGFGMYYIITKF